MLTANHSSPVTHRNYLTLLSHRHCLCMILHDNTISRDSTRLDPTQRSHHPTCRNLCTTRVCVAQPQPPASVRRCYLLCKAGSLYPHPHPHPTVPAHKLFALEHILTNTTTFSPHQTQTQTHTISCLLPDATRQRPVPARGARATAHHSAASAPGRSVCDGRGAQRALVVLPCCGAMVLSWTCVRCGTVCVGGVDGWMDGWNDVARCLVGWVACVCVPAGGYRRSVSGVEW